MSVTTITAGVTPRRSGPRYSLNEKIDICRGVLAFLVVSAHALELAVAIDPAGFRLLRPGLREFLTYVAGTGLYYVMGFFVISGYCIQLSAARLTRDGFFPIKTYLMARLTRILPLYYLALLTTIMVETLVAATRAPVWSNGLNGPVLLGQIVVIQNFTQTFGSFAPSWSITNELVYYVMFGALAAILVQTRVRPATLGMVLCVVVGAITHLLYRSGNHSPIILSTGLLFGLGLNWFLGAEMAIHGESLAMIPLVRLASRLWGPTLALIMALWLSQRVHLEFIYLGAGIAFTLLLLRFLVVDAIREPRNASKPAPITVAFGLASYPTYLFHGPILLGLGSMIMGWSGGAPWWLVWPLGTGVGISAGLILGHLAEKPIMAWRAELLKRMQPSQGRPQPRTATPVFSIQQ